MGLLGESWDDPKSQAIMQLAGGLLAGNMGQGVAGYGSVMAGARDKDMQRKFMQSQIDENAAQIEQKKLAAVKAQELQSMLGRMFGPQSGGTSPGAFQPSADGRGPTMPESMRPAQRATGVAGLSIDDVAQLKAMGGPDFLEAFKWAKDPLKLDQGATYQDRVTGKERYMPKVGEGIAPNAQGFYGDLPGYAASIANIEGAKAGAVEKAKARLDPFTFTPKGSPNPVLSNRAEVMQPVLGVPQPGVTSSGYAGGSRDGANAESIRMMESEISKLPPNHPDVPSIKREIARMQNQSGIKPGGMELQSPSEAAKLLGTAQADVVRETAATKKVKSSTEMLSDIARAKELLKQGPTSSGMGEMADKTAGFFGATLPGADVAGKLDIVAGSLVNNVPRMEGPQSDGDRIDYKTQAGRMADRSLPIKQRLAAADELERLHTKYAGLNGGDAPTQSAPMSQAPQGAVNMLKMNPKLAADFDAKYGAGSASRILGK